MTLPTNPGETPIDIQNIDQYMAAAAADQGAPVENKVMIYTTPMEGFPDGKLYYAAWGVRDRGGWQTQYISIPNPFKDKVPAEYQSTSGIDYYREAYRGRDDYDLRMAILEKAVQLKDFQRGKSEGVAVEFTGKNWTMGHPSIKRSGRMGGGGSMGGGRGATVLTGGLGVYPTAETTKRKLGA
jgi:hypothetical protein